MILSGSWVVEAARSCSFPGDISAAMCEQHVSNAFSLIPAIDGDTLSAGFQQNAVDRVTLNRHGPSAGLDEKKRQHKNGAHDEFRETGVGDKAEGLTWSLSPWNTLHKCAEHRERADLPDKSGGHTAKQTALVPLSGPS